jgi:hypothetical protein
MRELLLFSFLFTIACAGFAQAKYYNRNYIEGAVTYELLAGTAAMNCLTDLGGKQTVGQAKWKDLNWEMTKPAFSVAGIISYCRNIALRFNVVSGSVTADDALVGNQPSPARGRFLRNLHFASRILEASFIGEVYPINLFAREGAWLPAASPYFSAGGGCFYFEPTAVIRGVRERLRPLRTEGQGFEEYPQRNQYRNLQPNLCFGAGIKSELSPVINLRVEILVRKLFTDYLDDVSTDYINPGLYSRYHPPSKTLVAKELADRRRQGGTGPRGNSRKNDAYFTVGIAGSWVFGREIKH